MNEDYTGGWTALVTPFEKGFSVDWNQLEKNVLFQVEEGISGILPMGTTGESATVTHEEHSRIILKGVEYAAGRCHVLAGTGSNSTEEAVYETEKAVAAGIKSCLLVDCYYNKPSSMELRKEYYSVLLEEFPDIDFISYAIPGLFCGSVDSMCSTSLHKPLGAPRFIRLISRAVFGTSPSCMRLIRFMLVTCPGKKGRPVNSVHMVAPREYMSHLAETSLSPLACSGAM